MASDDCCSYAKCDPEGGKWAWQWWQLGLGNTKARGNMPDVFVVERLEKDMPNFQMG
jgi:hypothetical protein